MTQTSPFPLGNRRLAALALTLALHLALLWGWRLSTRADTPDPSGALDRIQVLLVPRAEPATPPKPRPVPAVAAPAPPRTVSVARRREAPAIAPEAPAAEAKPFDAPPSTTVLERAKLAIGAIDRELQKEGNSGKIRAKPVTAQMRLERTIQQAHDMAPNKWYEAPKVTGIVDPGGYGRRRYRVVGALGTYCVTYESNHAPDGIDSIQRGIKPKLTSCPEHEQAATSQKWD